MEFAITGSILSLGRQLIYASEGLPAQLKITANSCYDRYKSNTINSNNFETGIRNWELISKNQDPHLRQKRNIPIQD